MNSNSTVIILSAFGSTLESARHTIDSLVSEIQSYFIGIPCILIYTSARVRQYCRMNNIYCLSIAEALNECQKKNYSKIIIQSLHIFKGEEFDSLLQAIPLCNSLYIGMPLISGEGDAINVCNQIKRYLPLNTPSVILAHGSNSSAFVFDKLKKIQEIVHESHKQSMVCSIDGAPGVKPLYHSIFKYPNITELSVQPLMLTSGAHIYDDILGEGIESWKTKYNKIHFRIGPPLGDMEAIRKQFILHIENARSIYEFVN